MSSDSDNSEATHATFAFTWNSRMMKLIPFVCSDTWNSIGPCPRCEHKPGAHRQRIWSSHKCLHLWQRDRASDLGNLRSLQASAYRSCPENMRKCTLHQVRWLPVAWSKDTFSINTLYKKELKTGKLPEVTKAERSLCRTCDIFLLKKKTTDYLEMFSDIIIHFEFRLKQDLSKRCCWNQQFASAKYHLSGCQQCSHKECLK